MTIAELQQEFLSLNEKHLASEDFFILLARATQKEKVFLLAHPEYRLAPTDEARARDFFRRRLQHEPVAYITGHKEFYGYDFRVTKDTLIPRPETELIVEKVLKLETRNLKLGRKRKSSVIIDVGTGSGNIIISIACELKKIHSPRLPDGQEFSILDSPFSLHATDISQAALSIAEQNAKRHNVESLIKFYKGDLLAPLNKKLFSKDKIIITANLPYLSRDLYEKSPKDVRNFEPKGALLSKRAGLDHYFRLLKNINILRTQKQSFHLFLEISPEQALSLKNVIPSLFSDAKIIIHKDLAGKERIVEIVIK